MVKIERIDLEQRPFEEILQAVDNEIALAVEGDRLTPSLPLPQEVERFCGKIDSNFNTTIDLLQQISNSMLKMAEELEERANKLKNAKPEVSDHLREWVRFERECHARGDYFKSLFK